MTGKADLPPDLAEPVGHRDRIQELARGLLGSIWRLMRIGRVARRRRTS